MSTILQKLIQYVVYEVADQGGWTTALRLAKFLYLIDVEMQREYGKPLTGLRWVYHHYGPWAFELPKMAAGLGYRLQQEQFRSGERKGTLYRSDQPVDLEEMLSFGKKAIVDRVLKAWAVEDDAVLLEYVYFSTEPMLAAKQGEPLDLSIIPHETRHFEIRINIPADRRNALREKLKAALAQEDADLITPAPLVFDEVYREALRAEAREEQARIPCARAGFSGMVPPRVSDD
jgi:hypothetical protein